MRKRKDGGGLQSKHSSIKVPSSSSSSSSSSSATKHASMAPPVAVIPATVLSSSLENDPTMNQLDDIISNIERMQVPHGNNSLRFEFTLLTFLLCHLCLQNYRKICFNLLVLASILSNSFYFVYQLFLKHPLKNFLFLFYPAVSYFLFFGYNAAKNRTPTEKAMHKFKKIIFNTIECGYLAGFLPLKFLQSEHIYFDPIRAIILMVFLLVNCFVMFFTHLLSTSFYELCI